MREPLTMKTEVLGDGEPLILMGGGLTGWLGMRPLAERLMAGREVVLPQLLNVQLGLEDRSLPPGYSVRMESEALAAALDGLSLGRPLDFIAWSYGALVTLDFALNRPEWVRTLTLIEPPALWVLTPKSRNLPEIAEQERVLRALHDDISEAQLEEFLYIAAIVPPESPAREAPQWPVWTQHRRSLRNSAAVVEHQDDRARLERFQRPVLLVTGTGTAAFLRAIVEALQSQLPRAQTVEMPGGHAPHLASTDQFLHEVAAFQAAAA
jgi:lipase